MMCKRPWGQCGLFGLVALCFTTLAVPVNWAVAQEEPGTELYYSGNALYMRKLYTLAVQEYRKFLAAYPGHSKAAAARMGLALSLYSAGEYKEAEPLLGQIVTGGKGENIEDLTVYRGHCLLKLGRPAEAEEVFSGLLKLPATGGWKEDALAGLVQALFVQEKWQALLDVADKNAALALKGKYVSRVQFQRAFARHRLKDYAGAINVIEGLRKIGTDPEFVQQVSFLLAECKRETGDMAGSEEHYAAASGGVEGSLASEALYRLGFVRFEQKKYQPAIADFTSFRTKYPKHELADQAGVLIGQCWVELKQYGQAEQALRPFVARADGLLWLARTYSRQNNFAQATATLQGSIDQMAKDRLLPDLRFDLANALLAQEKHAEASAVFAKLLAASPDWTQAADATRLQALCLHKAKDYKQSLALCTSYLTAYAKDAGRAEVLFLKAENLFMLDMDADALTAYREFISAYAQDSRVEASRLRLSQILHRKKQWADALKEAAPLLAKPPVGDLYRQLFFVAGDCSYNLQQWDDAIKQLQAFLAAQPKEPNADTALVKLGFAAIGKSDSASAMAHLLRLVAEHPASTHMPMALAELGRLQYEAKQYDAARKSLEQVVAAHAQSPQRPNAEYYLGWVSLAQQGREAEAAQHFGLIVAQYPQHTLLPDSLLQLSILQIKAKDFAKAQAGLSQLVQAQPTYPKRDHAVYYLGIALARQAQWQQALASFQKLAADFPASALRDKALYEASWCWKGLKQPADAAKSYEKLLADFPNSELKLRAMFELSEIEYDGGKYDTAIGRLKAVLGTVQDKELKEQSLYRFGWAYYSATNYLDSAKAFEQLLGEFPQSALRAAALFQAGEARMKLKEYPAANAHYSGVMAATKDAATLEPAMLRLGETQGLIKQWAQSEQTYVQFIQTYQKSAWLDRARFGLGWAKENQQQYDAAIAAYREVLARRGTDETSARAQFQVGECLFAQKKYDEAVAEFSRVGAGYGFPRWSSMALLESGRALESKGDKDTAISTFKEVMKQYGDTDAAVVAKERLAALGQK